MNIQQMFQLQGIEGTLFECNDVITDLDPSHCPHGCFMHDYDWDTRSIWHFQHDGDVQLEEYGDPPYSIMQHRAFTEPAAVNVQAMARDYHLAWDHPVVYRLLTWWRELGRMALWYPIWAKYHQVKFQLECRFTNRWG